MNPSLERIAQELELASPSNKRLRLEFGYVCVRRVSHLLEEAAVIKCVETLGQYLDSTVDEATFDSCVVEAARLATEHQGSRSIDGCGHAAVSASYAVANAMAGRALQAAEYAAYAAVYGQGGYGAVAELQSFEPEFLWQANSLVSLGRQITAA